MTALETVVGRLKPHVDYKIVFSTAPPYVVAIAVAMGNLHRVMGANQEVNLLLKDPQRFMMKNPYVPVDPSSFRAGVIKSDGSQISIVRGSEDFPEPYPTMDELTSTIQHGNVVYL